MSTPEFVVKKNGENEGKIYKFLEYSHTFWGTTTSYAYYRGTPGRDIMLNMDNFRAGISDYEVYEPKIGDNILPLEPAQPFSGESLDRLRLVSSHGDVKGFIIDSIINSTSNGKKKVLFILRDKETGNRVERGMAQLDKSKLRLALAKCIDTTLLENVPIELIQKIAVNIKIPELFEPSYLKIDLQKVRGRRIRSQMTLGKRTAMAAKEMATKEMAAKAGKLGQDGGGKRIKSKRKKSKKKTKKRKKSNKYKKRSKKR